MSVGFEVLAASFPKITQSILVYLTLMEIFPNGDWLLFAVDMKANIQIAIKMPW